jgi:replicative DNA helicase
VTLDNKSPRLYVPTGLTDLDRLLDGGLPGAKLTILAAQPGMGAQSFALGMAAHAARCQHPVLYCPLENAAEEICPMLEDRVTGRVNAPIDVDDNIRGVPDLVHAISALR